MCLFIFISYLYLYHIYLYMSLFIYIFIFMCIYIYFYIYFIYIYFLCILFHSPQNAFIARWILALLLVLYAMDIIFELCVGCAVFQLLILCKLVPQSTCALCSMVFKTKDDERDRDRDSVTIRT